MMEQKERILNLLLDPNSSLNRHKLFCESLSDYFTHMILVLKTVTAYVTAFIRREKK